MDPRVRLREALAAIKDQECQWIVRVIAVLGQERSTMVAFHGNQEKGWLGLVMLQPASAATAEIAQPIEDHYSIVGQGVGHGRISFGLRRCFYSTTGGVGLRRFLILPPLFARPHGPAP
jgi:hypothetical protein